MCIRDRIWTALETLSKTPEMCNITGLMKHLEDAGVLEVVGWHVGLVELSTNFAYHFQLSLIHI